MPTNAMTLDSHIDDLCAAAALWLVQAAMCAKAIGATLPQGIAALMPRVHTGYMPKASRDLVRGRAIRDGLVPPPKRATADEQTRALAASNGFVGGVYVGGSA